MYLVDSNILITANFKDFDWIESLNIINPIT